MVEQHHQGLVVVVDRRVDGRLPATKAQSTLF